MKTLTLARTTGGTMACPLRIVGWKGGDESPDRAWFGGNPGRSARQRRPLPHEVPAHVPLPRDARLLIYQLEGDLVAVLTAWAPLEDSDAAIYDVLKMELERCSAALEAM